MTMDPTSPDQPEPGAPAAEPGAPAPAPTEPVAGPPIEAAPSEPTPAADAPVAPAPDAVVASAPSQPTATSAEVPASVAAVGAVAAAPAATASPPPPAAPAAPPAAWQPPPEPAGPFPGVRFADHGARLISFILDHLIILGISLLILIAFGVMAALFNAAGADFLTATSVLAAIIGFFATYFVYFPYFWTKNGQTLGMRLFRLRVVMDKDGGKVTLGPAILRLIGYWIDQIVFYLGYIWVLVDSRRRGWHDLIAGTVVIQEG